MSTWLFIGLTAVNIGVLLATISKFKTMRVGIKHIADLTAMVNEANHRHEMLAVQMTRLCKAMHQHHVADDWEPKDWRA